MRLILWILFGVGSAVLPLLLTGIVMFDHGKYHTVSDTWSGGELLLVSMTLMMASLGELIAYESKYPQVKAFISAIALFLIVVSAVWYMDTFGSIMAGGVRPQEPFLRAWSLSFFGFCLTTATVCVMLPKRQKEDY